MSVHSVALFIVFIINRNSPSLPRFDRGYVFHIMVMESKISLFSANRVQFLCCIGLVSIPSVQCLGLVSVSTLQRLGLVSASYVWFTQNFKVQTEDYTCNYKILYFFTEILRLPK